MRNKLTFTVTAAIMAFIIPIGFSPAEEAKPMVTRGVFSVPVSRAEVVQDWYTRSYDCNLGVYKSGWTSSNHVHHSDEVITAIEGRVALVVGEQRFEAEPGDELFLPTNTMHRLENSHDGLLKMFYGLKHFVGAPPNRCRYPSGKFMEDSDRRFGG
jgi:mannose-6-phosphate isomerase-like protein (cupin superfamily)